MDGGPVGSSGRDAVAAFLEAACVPLEAGHGTGTLDEAEAIRAADPAVAAASVHTAAVLGDDEAVRSFLAADPAAATRPGGPRGWDALTHLCFSRYLRLDPLRSDGLVRAATALLDAGASPTTGWYDPGHQPEPVLECALYGAAGVAHHPGLTRLLLERGADPNDPEVLYHAPEGWDNGALEALVESGRITPDGLATLLLRKCDWHDWNGVLYLLEHGTDPNRRTRWGYAALHQALRRDNALAVVEALLDRGADPHLPAGPQVPDAGAGQTAVALAARRGRGDVLAALERRGVADGLAGPDRLVAACARDDGLGIRSLVAREPQLVDRVRQEGGALLGAFAGNDNAAGVGRLLELGVEVAAPWPAGDGYFGTAPHSTALHVAAWRARHATVAFLLDRGAPVDALDGRGRTPLELAAKACVDAWWSHLRAPDSVAALLQAGASAARVPVPTGYGEVDALLRRAGEGSPSPPAGPAPS